MSILMDGCKCPVCKDSVVQPRNIFDKYDNIVSCKSCDLIMPDKVSEDNYFHGISIKGRTSRQRWFEGLLKFAGVHSAK